MWILWNVPHTFLLCKHTSNVTHFLSLRVTQCRQISEEKLEKEKYLHTEWEKGERKHAGHRSYWAECHGFFCYLTQWLEASHHIHPSSIWLTCTSDLIKMVHGWLLECYPKRRQWGGYVEVPFDLVTKAFHMPLVSVGPEEGLLQQCSLFLGSFTSAATAS